MSIFNRVSSYPRKINQLLRNLRFLSGFDLNAAHRDYEARCEYLKTEVSSWGGGWKQWQARVTGMLGTLAFDPWLASSHNRHKGERCYLIGCGPSLKEMDFSKLRGEHIMGVNGTMYIEDIQLKYFASVSHIFWKHHQEALKKVRCERRFLPTYLKELESNVSTSWLNSIEAPMHEPICTTRPWFFSYDPARYVVLGGSVMFVSLQILYYLGYSEVVLLGVDHDYGEAESRLAGQSGMVDAARLDAHFIKNYYPKGGEAHIDVAGTERGFQLALNAFEQDDRKLLNATPGTKLDIVPKVSIS